MTKKVVIVDYGVGNLFSIERALSFIGAQPEITDSPSVVQKAERIILPGVGAFANGMKGLSDRGLVGPVLDHAKSGKPLLGICLGMQLLMSESEEFGRYCGLDIIKGRVVRIVPSQFNLTRLKIPHVGWSSVTTPESVQGEEIPTSWRDGILKNLRNGFFAYFVHSFAVVADDGAACAAYTTYGNNKFCSVIRHGNLYGCQFHPERSGRDGLEIYRNFVFNCSENNIKQEI